MTKDYQAQTTTTNSPCCLILKAYNNSFWKTEKFSVPLKKGAIEEPFLTGLLPSKDPFCFAKVARKIIESKKHVVLIRTFEQMVLWEPKMFISPFFKWVSLKCQLPFHLSKLDVLWWLKDPQLSLTYIEYNKTCFHHTLIYFWYIFKTLTESALEL